MFRHVTLFRFVPEATDSQRQAVADGLRALPAQIPELREYHVGPDAGHTDGAFDFAVVAVFDDEAGWRTYLDHPAHQAVAQGAVLPILAERATAQYES